MNRRWFVFVLLLGACGEQSVPPLVASKVEIIRAMPGQAMGVAYLTLENNTDSDIQINAISSADYDKVEIHESSLQNGVAKMRRLERITIAANSTVQLERGGKHLMLIGRSDAKEVSLSFYDGATLILSVTTAVMGRND